MVEVSCQLVGRHNTDGTLSKHQKAIYRDRPDIMEALCNMALKLLEIEERVVEWEQAYCERIFPEVNIQECSREESRIITGASGRMGRTMTQWLRDIINKEERE